MTARSAWRAPQIVHRPLVPIAIALTLGVLFGPPEHETRVLVFAIAFFVVTTAAAFRRRIFSALLVLVGFFFVGLVLSGHRLPPRETVTRGQSDLAAQDFAAVHAPPTVQDSRADQDVKPAQDPATDPRVLIEGIVPEAPELGLDEDAIFIDITETATAPCAVRSRAEGRARIRAPHRAEESGLRQPACGEVGDRIRVLARLDPPPPESDAPHRRPKRAAHRGVTLEGVQSTPETCVILEHANAEHPWTSGHRAPGHSGIGALVAAAIDRDAPRSDAALLRALATGDRTKTRLIDEALLERAGMTHLFWLGGFYLAVLVALVTGSLRRAFAELPRIALGIGVRRIAALAGILLVATLVAIQGATPSAMRGALPILALLLPAAAGKSSDPLSALALALIVSVAWDPTSLGDVSFQVAFAGVSAILRLYPALSRRLSPRLNAISWWWRWPLRLALASVAVTAGVSPLIARHFDDVCLLGLVASVITIPLAAVVVVPLAVAGGVVGMVNDSLSSVLLTAGSGALSVLLAVAEAVRSVPAAFNPAIPRPTVWGCLLYYGVTILISGSRRPRAEKH